MKSTSRELVVKALEFKNPERVPRHLWTLPWADLYFHDELINIRKDFPDDIALAPLIYKTPPKSVGDPSVIGTWIDEWGCIYENVQIGIMGEVKEPLIEDLKDVDKLRLPEELLSVDIEKINEFCRSTDKFVISYPFARPFERLQFIRKTENVYIDLGLEEEGIFILIDKIHQFLKNELKVWCSTEIDGIWFMDDWGSQNNLLISPKMWKEIFKPMYKEYVDIIHESGKKAFFHSDGYTLDIIPDMIEIGVDAINLQIFCIGLENLKQFKGKITFWGEMDRQHILPHGSIEDVKNAVNDVKEAFFDTNGGIIAQCEFGAGAKPENVKKYFEEWK